MSDYYNEKVKKWDDMLLYSPAPRARRKMIMRLLKKYARPGKTLMDIGCANGLLLSNIRDEFGSLVLSGCDISNETVQANRESYPEINFYHMDIGIRIRHNEQYEIITCSEVLEHVLDIEIAVENIKKLLKPEGIAIITVPSGRIYPIDKMVGHLKHFKDTGVFRKHFKIKYEINWGFPFFNLYKYLINIKPEAMNKSFGESEYTVLQRLFSDLVYFLFKLNMPFWGRQRIVVLQKTSSQQ